MARRGPKLKIGPAEEKQIFAVLSVGGSLADAADCLGIHRETLINQGKRDPKFSKGMMKAAAKGKISLIRRVGKAPQWQAAAWMLERKWGEEFGKKDKLEHSGEVKFHPITLDGDRDLGDDAVSPTVDTSSEIAETLSEAGQGDSQ